jgi:uncharacterized protein YkwD
MSVIRRIRFISSVGILVASSCTSPLLIPVSISTSKNDPIADDVHVAVNKYRETKNKSQLIRHAGLDRLAAEHAHFLTLNSGKFSIHGKKVSHYGIENRVLAARRIHNMESLSEIVAACTATPQQAADKLLRLWQQSPGHNQQLLGDWTHTGIGSATGPDGTVCCTQLFAIRGPSRPLLRERFSF